jgi:hypothetical protein
VLLLGEAKRTANCGSATGIKNGPQFAIHPKARPLANNRLGSLQSALPWLRVDVFKSLNAHTDIAAEIKVMATNHGSASRDLDSPKTRHTCARASNPKTVPVVRRYAFIASPVKVF